MNIADLPREIILQIIEYLPDIRPLFLANMQLRKKYAYHLFSRYYFGIIIAKKLSEKYSVNIENIRFTKTVAINNGNFKYARKFTSKYDINFRDEFPNIIEVSCRYIIGIIPPRIQKLSLETLYANSFILPQTIKHLTIGNANKIPLDCLPNLETLRLDSNMDIFSRDLPRGLKKYHGPLLDENSIDNLPANLTHLNITHQPMDEVSIIYPPNLYKFGIQFDYKFVNCPNPPDCVELDLSGVKYCSKSTFNNLRFLTMHSDNANGIIRGMIAPNLEKIKFISEEGQFEINKPAMQNMIDLFTF